MPATADVEKCDGRQQSNSGRRPVTVFHGLHLDVGDGVMLERCFFGDLQCRLLTVIKRQEITSLQCRQVSVGDKYIGSSILPFGVAPMDGGNAQTAKLEYSTADMSIGPQRCVEILEPGP